MSRKQLWFIYAVILWAPLLYFGGGCPPEGESPSSRLQAAAVNLRQQIVYVGTLPAAAKDKPIAILELQSLAARAPGFLFTGTIRVRGKITAQTVGTVLPAKMRFQLRLKRAGKVVFTEFWDFNVLSNGNIPIQNFGITKTSPVNLKDILQFSILPLDRNSPVSTANLTINYSLPPANSAQIEAEENVEAAAVAQRFQLTFVGVLPASPAGVSAGGINLKAIRGPLLTWNGNLHVRGRVTPIVPGTPIPTLIRLVVKHKRLNGTVLRTETFNVNVQSNGLVTLQSFPFTTVNASNIKEALEISLTPLGRTFPLSTANLTMSFTALPGTWDY